MDYRIRWLNRFTDGWMAYFWLADAEPMFRRLRQVRWKEWKTTATKRRNLRIRGISAQPLRDRLGLKTLSHTWRRLNRTA